MSRLDQQLRVKKKNRSPHGELTNTIQIKYIKWALASSVPLFIRTAYGLLGAFLATGDNIVTSAWSPLFGSAVAFSLMALLPEYVVLGMYVRLGFHRLRTGSRGGGVAGSVEEGGGKGGIR